MFMPRACAVMPQVASRPIKPSTWSPCMCVMKILVIWLMLRSLRRSWCCVPSPQSKSHTSPRCAGLRATHETFRERVGTPALVPKKVTRKTSNPLPFESNSESNFAAQTLDAYGSTPAAHCLLSLLTDEHVALYPEAPRLERVLFGVVDAYARARGYLFRPQARARVFEPDARAFGQVFAVEAPVNSERLAELARPRSQLALLRDGAALPHHLDSLFGLDAAHEHGRRCVFRAGDHVELVVHA